ncbi:MAG TPA: Maf family protein [Flavisolibacter sp.]|jgi:septum formation protein|nr:Maf family protein [Flavisolibacter sp.]
MAGIILASQSPRRKQLLEWAEVEFEISVVSTEETYPSGLLPQEVAVHIAREKAVAVAPKFPDKTIVAADTIVVLGSEIIGKPWNRAEAIETLSKLNGKQHEVITGVVILKGDKHISFYDRTEVVFHQLQPDQLESYVDKYKPFDKAGAYAIQEWIGVVGIKSIKGDFYNVMGLPVSRVVQALEQLKSL